MNISDGEISGNTAVTCGGAISALGSAYINLQNGAKISNNSATSVTEPAGLGGRTISFAPITAVTGSSSVDGTPGLSEPRGGAIWVHCYSEMTTNNATTTRRSARAQINIAGDVTMFGNTVATALNAEDEPTGSGGAILNYSTCNIEGGIFKGNSAVKYGGAVRNISIMNISGGEIFGNGAARGGDICNNSVGVLNMTGGSVTGNIGGGVYSEGVFTVSGSPIVENNKKEGWFDTNQGIWRSDICLCARNIICPDPADFVVDGNLDVNASLNIYAGDAAAVG